MRIYEVKWVHEGFNYVQDFETSDEAVKEFMQFPNAYLYVWGAAIACRVQGQNVDGFSMN